MVRRRLEAGRLYRVQPNAYAVLPSITAPGRMMAAAFSYGRGSALSHRAGGAVWQLGPWPSGVIDVSMTRNAKPREGTRFHRVRHLEVVIHDGFPVTTPMRTLADLAATEPEPRVERAYEQADRLHLLDVVALEAECAGRRGSRLLRRLIAEGREAPPAKNELERALVSLCRDYDIPLPSQNVVVHGLEVDAYWPEAPLVVELDGWEWHRTRAAFENDRRRDARLARHGIPTLRFSWRQMTRERGSAAGAIRAGLRAAA
jgi:very-short-patch-repair endonuclease